MIKLFFFEGKIPWFCSFFQEICCALKRTRPGINAAIEWTKNAHICTHSVYFSLTSTSIDTAEVHSSKSANWGLW